jgi:hypothetical protein
MLRRSWVTAALLVSLPTSSARSQSVPQPSVVDTPTGRAEIIGLKRWTLTMLEDSLARYAPGTSLASHACAAVLRGKLRFADAAVEFSPPSPDRPKGFFAITVIEPQDSALVRYRAAPADSTPDRAPWAAAIAVFKTQPVPFQMAVQTPQLLLGQFDPERLPPPLQGAQPLAALLRATDPDITVATLEQILAADGNPYNRLIAAALLARFPQEDAAWRALALALRDPTPIVASTASQVLGTLARATPRPVDWTPAVESLRALLDGTNVSSHTTLSNVLAATQIDPALAVPLLRNGGELLAAKIRSENARAADAAHRLLMQLSGKDFGRDADAWAAWLRGL